MDTQFTLRLFCTAIFSCQRVLIIKLYREQENRTPCFKKNYRHINIKHFFLDLDFIEVALFSLEIISLLLRRCDYKKRLKESEG